jgi:hypothetical protein
MMMTMMGDENDDDSVSMSNYSQKRMSIQIQANTKRSNCLIIFMPYNVHVGGLPQNGGVGWTQVRMLSRSTLSNISYTSKGFQNIFRTRCDEKPAKEHIR